MPFKCLRRTSTLVFSLMITSAVPSNSVSINTVTSLSLYYNRHLSKPIFKQIGFLLQAGRGKSICHLVKVETQAKLVKQGGCPKAGRNVWEHWKAKNAIQVDWESASKLGDTETDREGRMMRRGNREETWKTGRKESLQERWRNYHFFPHNWLISQDRDSNSFEPSLSCSQLSHLRTKNASFLPCGRKLGLALFRVTRQKVCETIIDIGIKLSWFWRTLKWPRRILDTESLALH